MQSSVAASSASTSAPYSTPANKRAPKPVREDLTIENPTGLDLTWLGTSSGAPSINRNVSCCVVRSQHAAYLVDVGEGTQRQILKTSIKLNQVKRYV